MRVRVITGYGKAAEQKILASCGSKTECKILEGSKVSCHMVHVMHHVDQVIFLDHGSRQRGAR